MKGDLGEGVTVGGMEAVEWEEGKVVDLAVAVGERRAAAMVAAVKVEEEAKVQEALELAAAVSSGSPVVEARAEEKSAALAEVTMAGGARETAVVVAMDPAMVEEGVVAVA